MAGKYFWFAYPTKGKEFREQRFASHLDIHRLRDPAMMLTLSEPLQRRGKTFGGIITNIPASDLDSCKETITPKLPRLTADDVLVLPTRPPLSYSAADRIPSVIPSGTDLERQVLDATRKFFRILSRREAELTPEIIERLPTKAAQYKDLRFRVYSGAEIDAEGLHDQSSAYLFAVPEAIDASARLLAAFGIGGQKTFLLAQALRCQPNLIEDLLNSSRPRFLMAVVGLANSLPYPHLEYDNLTFDVVADVVL